VNTTVGNLEKGNFDTIAIMRDVARKRAAHPKVRQLVLSILNENGVKSHDFIDEAIALGTFVRDNVRYVRDPNDIEQLHDPLFLINQISSGTARGDCDDQALLLSTMLLSIGAQPFFCICRYREMSGPFNHIYTVVYETNWGSKRERLVLDTIIRDNPMGTEVPSVSRMEIPV
jgi:hypothetical protein